MIRPRFISIKMQFVMIAMLLVAISSTLWGWWAWQNERDLLYNSLEREAEQIVTSLSSPIINALLYEEMGVIEEGGLLDNFIEEIMNNPGLKMTYAFVTDQSGKVLAHNHYDEYGKIYTSPLTTAALSGVSHLSRLNRTDTPVAPVFEIAMPLRIHGKRWGLLQVGISTAAMQEELRILTRRIILTSSTFFMLGMLASYLIGRSMAKPLQRLSGIMSSIST
jgi:sensor histidine kinase YesM